MLLFGRADKLLQSNIKDDSTLLSWKIHKNLLQQKIEKFGEKFKYWMSFK